MEKNYPFYPVLKPFFRPHYASNDMFSAQRIRGLTPELVKKAYGFEGRTDGSGMKIAIVSAFDNVALTENLRVFCNEFSLQMPDVSVFYPQGEAETTTQRWITESSIDSQWASVFAQGAQLLLVFAKNAETENLLDGVRFAKTLSPDVVCMCFGTEESGAFAGENSIFQQDGIIFVSSSGDVGGVPSFPSTSPFVLSVGGTAPVILDDGKLILEEAWRNGGSGASSIFEIPSYQSMFKGISELSDKMRATPDISFCADEKNGCCVYVSSRGGWTTAGGTSLACACVSGICACIAKNNPALKQTGILQYMYNLAGGTEYVLTQYNFYDIVLGSNGVYYAMEGFDLCTGLGRPEGRVTGVND